MVYWKTLVRQNNAEQEARDKAISVKAEIDPTPKPKLAEEEKQEEVIVSKTATKPKAKKKAVKKVEEEEEDDNKE